MEATMNIILGGLVLLVFLFGYCCGRMDEQQRRRGERERG